MTVELFPGAALAPDVLLHQCLQDMEGVESAIVLKIDADGGVQISMSRMTLMTLAYAAMKLRLYADDVVSGRPPDGTDVIRPPGAA